MVRNESVDLVNSSVAENKWYIGTATGTVELRGVAEPEGGDEGLMVAPMKYFSIEISV